MSTVLTDLPPLHWTVADVQTWLPGFPVGRICLQPMPGTAIEKDVLEAKARTGRICELIDGTLVEKTGVCLGSIVAAELSYFIRVYLETNDLGILTGEAGLLRILPRHICAPDVSFIGWERFGGHKLPKAAIYAVAPDLAVEILSEATRWRR
jgi:Uma2 family endonuclease